MIGHWIYVFFRRGHSQVRNRQTILISFESTGPYQRNGASLVFMRCVVLEIRLFLIREEILDISLLFTLILTFSYCSLSMANTRDEVIDLHYFTFVNFY